jgi:hypothetical protein
MGGTISNASFSGDLSFRTDNISVKKGPYNISETKTLYYHWKNDMSEPVNVRLSLLVDWKQVPWSQNKLFIDTIAQPGDLIIKDIDLSEIVHKEISAICGLANYPKKC